MAVFMQLNAKFDLLRVKACCDAMPRLVVVRDLYVTRKYSELLVLKNPQLLNIQVKWVLIERIGW